MITITNGNNIIFGDDAESYFFEDGMIRLLRSINLGSGGADSIQVAGGNNKVIAGHENDMVTVQSGKLFVLGDEGQFEVTQRSGTIATESTLNTLNTAMGGSDSIIVLGGSVVALGGGAGDTIETTPGSTGVVIALGDGGEVTFDSLDRPIHLRSIEIYEGGNDIIRLGDQDDIASGGYGDDTIHTGEGDNIAVGDTIELHWDAYGVDRVLTFLSAVSEDPLAAGDDILVALSGSDVLFGGNGSDSIDAGSGEDIVASHNASLYLPVPQTGSVSGWGEDRLPRVLGAQLSVIATEYLVPINSGGDTGDGADTIHGGFGNDLILITPGGRDILYDSAGYDTISFQLAGQGVVFDVDYLNKPQYLVTPGMVSETSVTIIQEQVNVTNSPIENVIGSRYADVLFAGPTKTARTFKGGLHVDHPNGQPGDELRLRTYGNEVIDSGNILSVAGLGSIYHYEFETMEWIDATPMLIDDGDREWYEVGSGIRILRPSLIGGDSYYSTATKNDSSNFAGWSFSKLSSGPYFVSLSWPDPDPAYTYTPRVTIRDRDGGISAQRQINQKTEPVTGNYLGQKWYDFGSTVQIADDRYFNLEYNSNNLTYFLADSLRVERVRNNSAEIRTIDIATGTEVASGLTLTDFGDNYFGSVAYRDFRIVNLGAAPLKLNLVDREEATSEAQFRVVDGVVLEGAHRNSLPDGFSSAQIIYANEGDSSVAPGQSATLRIYVDTQRPGYHFGDFLLETNDVNESVFKLPISARVGSVAQLPRIIDNQSANFTRLSGTVNASTQVGTYDGTQHVGRSSTRNLVRWTQSDLPTANYRISVTWGALPLGDSKATFKVTWGNQTRTVVLSQQKTPGSNIGSYRSDGVDWVDLIASANISAGDTVRVELSGGAILADAIRIQQIGHVNYPSTPNLEIVDEATGQTVSSRFGVWDFGSLQLRTASERVLRIRNTGNATLNLSDLIELGPGFSITNLVDFLRVLQPGQSTALRILCEPMNFGNLRSELKFDSDDAENPHIGLVLKAKVLEEMIVTADDPTNFSMIGVLVPTGSVAPSGNTFSKRIAVGYNDGDSATWSFTNLQPGRYAVYATWDSRLVTSGGNVKPPLSRSVPYDIIGTNGESFVRKLVDQTLPADDQFSNNRRWEYLSDFTVTGNGLSITARNITPGATIHADAVRIVRLEYPETRVQIDGNALPSGSLLNFGRVDEGESATKKLLITNPSPNSLELRKILKLPVGFSTSFQPRTLAPGESTEIELTLTGERRGWYRDNLIISTGDPYSGVYQVTLLGEVMSPVMIIDDTDSRLSIVGNLPSNRNQSTAYLGGSKGLVVVGDRATWTLRDLAPGAYRVSMTWGAQMAAVNNAAFATITSSGILQSTWDQIKSPSDYSGAYWDNDHWWVDLTNSAIVGNDGVLQVSAIHPGPSFREVTLDAIRIERIVDSISGNPRLSWIDSVSDYSSTVVRGNLDNGYRLDFGTQTSPLSEVLPGSPGNRDYIRVDETTNYSYRRGFGWVGESPNALDQGGSDTDLSYLLRDGVWDTQERLLRLDLPAGTYRFTLSVGDAWNWDSVQRKPVLSSNPGKKTTKQIELQHERGGPVLLSLKPEIGSDYWMLSSLDVQKVDTIIDGTLDRIPSSSANNFFARATGVPSGSYTIDLDNATFGGIDADDAMEGIQVAVDASGLLNIPYTASSSTGTVEITAKHDQGIADYNAIFYNTSVGVDLKFDFNGSTSQTQTGYIAVPERTWYSPSRGYGWQNPLDTAFSIIGGNAAPPRESQWTDRTTPTSFDQTNLIGTSLTNLLRDGHKQTSTKEFRTDLPDGDYNITVTVGGPVAQADLDIKVVDQATQGIDNVSTLAGEYKRIDFIATATKGKLILQFSSSIARAEWFVNSIEIRNNASPVDIILSGGSLFDATRETPYSISVSVAPGNYTLTTNLGRLVSNDNDQRLSGIQVTVGSTGQLTFQLASDLPGLGNVLISSLDGNLHYKIPFEFRYPLLRKFDFNHTQTPVNTDGYRSVLPTNVYDSTKAFGWSSRAASVDRTSTSTSVVPQRLFQDKHTGTSPLYFMAAAQPGKTYDIRMHLGDTIARDLEISVNGQAFRRLSTAAGEYISPVLRTQSTDQRIEIYVRGSSIKEWSINGIEILEVTGVQATVGLPPASNLFSATPSSIQRNQTSAGASLLPGTYWISSDIGIITNSAGLRLNQVTIENSGLAAFTIVSSLPGAGTVRLDSADGTLRYEIPVAFRLNPIRLYDFDHVNRGVFSPSANGYTRVLATSLYSQAAGFGWNSPVKSVDRGSAARNLPTPTDLNRDKHFNSTPGSFFAMSEPGKSYSVTVYLGDTESRSVEVSLNGGVSFERINTAANSYTNRSWNLVANSDRIQVMFRKASGSNWSVNAIEIRELESSLTLSSRSAKVLAQSETIVGINEAVLPPNATRDLASTRLNTPLTIRVLDNDFSYFGALNSSAVELVSQPPHGKATVLEDGSIEVLPDLDYSGVLSFSYQVRDELGITSNYAQVQIHVTDTLHQNFENPLDVNADSVVNPLDALVLIDQLNRSGSQALTSQGNAQNQWFDVNGNLYLDPLDVLEVIDYLNRSSWFVSASGGAEGESIVDSVESPYPRSQSHLVIEFPQPLLDTTLPVDPKSDLFQTHPSQFDAIRKLEQYMATYAEELSDEQLAELLFADLEFFDDDQDDPSSMNPLD